MKRAAHTLPHLLSPGLCLCALLPLLAGCHTQEAAPPANPSSSSGARSSVGCFGRILPANGTFFVSQYVVNAGTPIVEQVDVKEGDTVAKDQVLAVLSSRPFVQQTVASAESELALAQARLARAKVAGSSAEQAALAEEVLRVQSQRDEAQRNFARSQALYQHDYLSKSRYQSSEAQLAQANAALQRARDEARNASVAQPEDVAIAAAQLRVAQAELARARDDERASIVRSPSHARVLRVMAHAGEPLGPNGVAELADIGSLEVIAEVYEADIARVRIGELADITADFLPAMLHGTVTSIGSEIEKQQPLAGDPGAPADARVFKVHIRVLNQEDLADRINGKVKVTLHA